MRWGEATALNVADVVLTAPVPYIIIDKAWKRDDHNSYYVDRPKTERSNREVTIDAGLAAVLAGLIDGVPQDAYLFLNEKGGPVMHRAFFRDVWEPAVNRAMERRPGNPVPLRYRPKIHGLRHSHGSWLLAEGVDMFTVQRRLGHESIETTTNIYGHISVRSTTAAADAMGRIMGS
jgi:integrase